MSYTSKTDLGNLSQAFVFLVLVKKCTVPNKQAAVMLPYICVDNSFGLQIPIDTADLEYGNGNWDISKFWYQCLKYFLNVLLFAGPLCQQDDKYKTLESPPHGCLPHVAVPELWCWIMTWTFFFADHYVFMVKVTHFILLDICMEFCHDYHMKCWVNGQKYVK